jgi:alkylated DNA repair dioxygenase AlkB
MTEATFFDPAQEPERLWFDETSWVDISRGWLHDADEVYATLLGSVAWHESKLWRYEKWVTEPRLGAFCASDALPHQAVEATQHAIQTRYRVKFPGVGLAYYRNNRDSVAFHRDREMRHLDETVVGILTLGVRRPFLVGPRGRRDKFLGANGGATHDLAPAGGDLMVFGGRFQADWEHCVPKVPAPLSGRISCQWRWTSGRGRPEIGGSYRAPREFSRSSSRRPSRRA